MSARQRILVFDRRSGGHHPLYAHRFARALSAWDPVVAAPSDVVAGLPSEVGAVDLGAPAPPATTRAETAAQGRDELATLARVARETGATRVVHLYADAVLPQWARSRIRLPPATICVFFSALHYPRQYRSGLTGRELMREMRTEAAIMLWRRRPEAGSILALEEANAERWAARGARAHWLPEPPVDEVMQRPQSREGVVLYGALAPHKGFAELTAALRLGPPPPYPVTLAGPVRPDYVDEVDSECEALVRSGVDVRRRFHLHDEQEGLQTLAGANCAVLPYRRHTGMSRVLLEAASVGTPVVVADFGLLAHLTRSAGLGVVARPDEPANLRAAIDALAAHPPSRAQGQRLADFAARYREEVFANAITRALDLPVEPQRRAASPTNLST
jgi:glycosyltransferase involved in cell wall biosynthesis